MSDAALSDKAASSLAPTAGFIRRALDSDIFYSFRRSRLTMVAAIVTLLFFVLAIAAPLIAVQNPFDPSELQLINSRIAPLWTADGQSPFLLGTDEQGRDVLSAILYGLRISLDRRHSRRGVFRSARHRARPDRRLFRRRDRRPDHAHRRRAAHLPRHPDRAAGQRGRQIAVRQPAGCHEHACRAGARDRSEFLGAICAHRARLGDGGERTRTTSRRRN